MKGVSPVVATVLMAAITIAAAVVAYSWFMSMQASVQADASRGAGSIGKERLSIDGFRCIDGNTLEVYVRNGGIGDFTGNITVIVRDASTDVMLHRDDTGSVEISANGGVHTVSMIVDELDGCRVQGSNSDYITVELITPTGAVASRTDRI